MLLVADGREEYKVRKGVEAHLTGRKYQGGNPVDRTNAIASKKALAKGLCNHAAILSVLGVISLSQPRVAKGSV
jgi:hypothetical protein